MFSSESRASKLRLIECDAAISALLCVMKMKSINLTVTLSKDERADQSCAASLIIVLRLSSQGLQQLSWSIRISRRST